MIAIEIVLGGEVGPDQLERIGRIVGEGDPPAYQADRRRDSGVGAHHVDNRVRETDLHRARASPRDRPDPRSPRARGACFRSPIVVLVLTATRSATPVATPETTMSARPTRPAVAER